MMNIELLLKIIGWSGTIFYILSYLLLVLRIIVSNSITYHLLNILGAIGLIINAMHFKDNANVLVNLVWLIIACGAIFNIIKSRKDIEQKNDSI